MPILTSAVTAGTPGPLRALSPASAAVAANADPRGDAALAMAEMQNGGSSISDFAGSVYSTNGYYNPSYSEGQDLTTRNRMSFAQQANQHNLAIENLAAGMPVDPSQYMAPMDLYESIWGGKRTEFIMSTILVLNCLYRITGPLEYGNGLHELRFPCAGATRTITTAILLLALEPRDSRISRNKALRWIFVRWVWIKRLCLSAVIWRNFQRERCTSRIFNLTILRSCPTE